MWVHQDSVNTATYSFGILFSPNFNFFLCGGEARNVAPQSQTSYTSLHTSIQLLLCVVCFCWAFRKCVLLCQVCLSLLLLSALRGEKSEDQKTGFFYPRKTMAIFISHRNKKKISCERGLSPSASSFLLPDILKRWKDVDCWKPYFDGATFWGANK